MGMCVKDLKGWRYEYNCKKYPEERMWEPVVRLVQVMFRDGTVLEEISWAKMILLHQDKVGYRGIGIVELLWKVFSVLVNCSLKMSVVLHETLHGFREWRGAGTAKL